MDDGGLLMKCDECYGDFNELVTVSAVSWYCEDCFKDIHKVNFDDYNEEHRNVSKVKTRD